MTKNELVDFYKRYKDKNVRIYKTDKTMLEGVLFGITPAYDNYPEIASVMIKPEIKKVYYDIFITEIQSIEEINTNDRIRNGKSRR